MACAVCLACLAWLQRPNGRRLSRSLLRNTRLRLPKHKGERTHASGPARFSGNPVELCPFESGRPGSAGNCGILQIRLREHLVLSCTPRWSVQSCHGLCPLSVLQDVVLGHEGAQSAHVTSHSCALRASELCLLCKLDCTTRREGRAR